ncbi:MAG: hypothetical protein ABI559_04470 [Chloroflexota bacterium]
MADPILVATSVDGRAVRLTQTIWRKIQDHHPEFLGEPDYTNAIRAAIEQPEFVLRGWSGSKIALAWCESAPAAPKYIAVVYRELNGDGFIITAFFISRFERLLKRGIVWQRT